MSHPRVLFLTYNFPPKLGGLEQVVHHVWTALSQRADGVVLAQFPGDYRDATPNIHRAARNSLLGYFAFVFRIGRRLVTRHSFDIVVAGSALVAMPAVYLANRAGARSVAILYGLDTVYPSLLYQAMYRYAMPKIDHVIAISRASRDEAVSRGVSADRIDIVHPGCDTEPFLKPNDTSSLRRSWGLEGARVILSAGRLVRRKGIDRFVRECLPKVVHQLPEAKLLLAGGNPEGALAHRDDMAASVRQAAEDVGLSRHVIVTGRLSKQEMASAFHLADVFVLPIIPTPGDMEGFGIVLLEAATAGKPVVATRIGGIPDAVEDGVTGILVPPQDYEAMADALIAFLVDSERSRRFGTEGRKRVLDSFTWEAAAKRYADSILQPQGR